MKSKYFNKCAIYSLLVLSTSIFFKGYSQVGVNTSSPDASSILDIVSTDKGILIPRMTEEGKNDIITPKKGLLIYQNNEAEGFWYYDGSIWKPIDTKGEFTSSTGVVHNVTNIRQDDFVFGSNSLNNIAGADDDSRFLFDKGKSAFRVGYNNTSSWDNSEIGSFSFSAGSKGTASGTYAVTMGRENNATGSYAVSIGRSNTVSAVNGTSFGYLNTVSADYGTTLGRSNTASGEYSLAGGIATTASGLHSVAFGTTSTASGENSFVFGRLNTASGLNSAAIGFTNTASSEGTFAFGNQSRATGVHSVAFGNNLSTPSYSEMAVGIYNTTYSPASTTETNGNDRIFSVGNGFRTGGVTTRNNAFTILKNGHVGIGTDTPNEALVIHGDDNFSGDADFDAHSYGSNITSFHIRSAAGTQNRPTAVSGKTNANFYNMEAQGYDGSTYRTASAIRMGVMATNLTGANDMPGRIDFDVAPDGTASTITRMRINDQGNVGINTRNTPITEKLVVNGKIKATSVNFSGLTTYANDSAAASGGLTQGDLYKTAAGDLKIKL
ncbi:hypothetical protein ULMS_19660 [Patiriisocius marinistellae]|uniref:Trimeric autotransporter adhesin YadA-like head domain-containing protein n=1 Tax=Patiriisocius marinistellae TaxID=2494560 RepID=A0A5J4FYK7_9FLAO|nr:hypothetical protein [Patiriisocius marinistellae]GEQ86458.1 hypothetical protein ULMS_19660 [Patiriisocius marinistellae]